MAEINASTILATSKLPAFVKDDHTKFVEFLDAYYEWLNDGYALTDHQSNTDVDKTVDGFFAHFENTYLAGLPSSLVYNPDGTRTSREIAIKNIKEFYGSKGTEKSFKFLFRILFDLNAEISYPKDNILRSSDGRWLQRKYLRVLASEVPTGWTSGTVTQPNWYSVVRETVTKIIGGVSYTEIFLDDETGVFVEGSPIFIGAVQLNPVRLLTGVTVLNGGLGHSEGESLGGGTAVVSVASVGLNGEIESIKVLEPGDSSGTVVPGISATESLAYNSLFRQQELALTGYANFLERLYGITSVTAQVTTPLSAPALVVGARSLTEKFDPQDWNYWSTNATTTSANLSALLYERITTDANTSQSDKERLLAYLGTSPSLFANSGSPTLGQSWIYSENKNSFSAYNLNGTNLGVGVNSYSGGNQESKDTTKFLLKMSNILFPLIFNATFKARFSGDPTYYTVFESKISALSSQTLSTNETNRYNILIDNDQLYTLSATEKQNLYTRILAMIGTLHPVWGVLRSHDLTKYDTTGFPSGLDGVGASKGFKATVSPLGYDVLKRLCGYVNFDGTTFTSYFGAVGHSEIIPYEQSISISDACKLRKPYSYGSFTTLWSNADETPYDIQYEYFFALQPSVAAVTTVNGIVPSGLTAGDYTSLRNHINTSVITYAGIEYSYKIKRLYAQIMYGFDEIGMPKEKAIDPNIKPYIAKNYTAEERLYKQNTKIYRGSLPTDLSSVATQAYAMPGKSIERKWTKLPHLLSSTRTSKNIIMWKLPLYPETYANFLADGEVGSLVDIRNGTVIGTFTTRVCEVHQRVKSSGTKLSGSDIAYDTDPTYGQVLTISGIPGRNYDPTVVSHVLLNYETSPIPLQSGETGYCSTSVDMLFAVRSFATNTLPIQPLFGDGDRYTSTVAGIPQNTSYLIPNDTERVTGSIGTSSLSPGTVYNNTTVETYLCVIGEIANTVDPQLFAYNENYALKNVAGQLAPLSALEVRIPGYPEQVDPYCDVVLIPTTCYRTATVSASTTATASGDFIVGDILTEVGCVPGTSITPVVFPGFYQKATVTNWVFGTRNLTISELGIYVNGGLAGKYFQNSRTGYVYTGLSSVSSTSTYPKLTGTLNVVTETDTDYRTRTIVPQNTGVTAEQYYDKYARFTVQNRLISASALCVNQSAFSDCYVSSNKLLLANIVGNKGEFARAISDSSAVDSSYRYDSINSSGISYNNTVFNALAVDASRAAAGSGGTGYSVSNGRDCNFKQTILGVPTVVGTGIYNGSGGGGVIPDNQVVVYTLTSQFVPGLTTIEDPLLSNTTASYVLTLSYPFANISITAPGSGYAVGDKAYVTMANAANATVTVTSVNGSGGVTGLIQTVPTVLGGSLRVATGVLGVSDAKCGNGFGYLNGAATSATTSGSGSGLQMNITVYSNAPQSNTPIPFETVSKKYVKRVLETTLTKGANLRYTRPTLWSAPATYTNGTIFPQQLVTCDNATNSKILYKMTGYTNTYQFYGSTRPVVFLQDATLTTSSTIIAETLVATEPTDLSGVSLSASSLFQVTMASGVFTKGSAWTWSATTSGGAGPSWIASNGSGYNTTSGTAVDQNIFTQGFGLNSKYGTLNSIDERVSIVGASGLRGTQPPRELASNVVYTPEEDLFYFEPNEKTQIENYLKGAYTIVDPTTWLEANKAKVLPVYGYKATEVGSFTTSDGFASSDKVTQDNRYYQNYSYVISSAINIDEYKEVVKNVTHPAGYAMFGRVVFETTQEPKMGVTTTVSTATA